MQKNNLNEYEKRRNNLIEWVNTKNMKNVHAQELGKIGGLKKSKRKAESSRKNGKKGGRPKSFTTPPRLTLESRTMKDIFKLLWFAEECVLCKGYYNKKSMKKLPNGFRGRICILCQVNNEYEENRHKGMSEYNKFLKERI